MAVPESPITFSKYVTCVTHPAAPVYLPRTSEKVDYEAELAVVVGRRAKHVTRERAFHHVLGYTNFNDVSARDFQFADGQWQRGKSCDTFAPMGPAIVTTDEVADPHRLGIKLRLNGETMQNSTTEQLIFGVDRLIAFLSETVTLEPGDIIATGTPPGVGFARKPPVFLKPGDLMEVEVEGLGVLSNPVLAEPV
jgi:2-keto-4-pentenoate hydratase/2-oxohepta-3-ene-1,7-dioic acid hydratase in catechol pathway